MGDFVKSRQTPQWAKILFFSIISGMLLVSPSGRAQESYQGTLIKRCSWSEPTYGTPVQHYILQVESREVVTDTAEYYPIMVEYYDLELKFNVYYRARVAGVDAEGRQGPWSLWTPEYSLEKLHEESPEE